MTDIERICQLAGLFESHPQLQPLPAAQHIIDKYIIKVASALVRAQGQAAAQSVLI